MPVLATYPYEYEARDAVETFHGNQLTFVHWRRHLMFAAPVSLPLPAAMPFGVLINDVLPGIYGVHPDWARIDWSVVDWTLNEAPIKPDFAASLGANGFSHKSLLTFATPGLNGIGDSGT